MREYVPHLVLQRQVTWFESCLHCVMCL